MNNLQEANQGLVEQAPFGTVQHNLANIMPTASEIGNLWQSYYAESMSIAFLKIIVTYSTDPDIKPILQKALDVSSQRVQTMENLLNSIYHPIPAAFGEKDVDTNAKPLFSESFTLIYTRLMHKYVLINYTKALTSSYRSDFRSFFSECIKTSDEIYQKATEVLLGKGILVKCPSIIIPDRVDFVHNKSYFGNWFGNLFGDQRPLNTLEIGGLYSIIEIQHLAKTVILGDRQVVKSEKIKNYLSKTLERLEDDMEKFIDVLNKEYIPVPVPSDFLFTDSKESLISDKLLLSHLTATIAFSITAFGIALPDMLRKDLVLMMRNGVTKVLLMAEEGAELMIEAGWMEKIPQTVDREDLLH
jgi:hypothetical protein